MSDVRPEQAASPVETHADSQAWRDRRSDSDVPALTVKDMVLDHDKRIFMIERFSARAEPLLFDSKTGLAVVVAELVEARNDREAQMRLIRWAVLFAGGGLGFTLISFAAQAAGLAK